MIVYPDINILIVAKVIAHVPSPAGEGRDEGGNKMQKIMQRFISTDKHSIFSAYQNLAP